MPAPKIDRLRYERHAQAEKNYQMALQKMKKSEEAQFKDTQELHVIGKHFNAAIRQNHARVEYHTDFAYFLLLLGDEAEARKRLNQAKKIDPDYAPIKLLEQGFQELQSFTVKEHRSAALQAFNAIPNPQNSDDFDLLYEEFESFLHEQLRLVLADSIHSEVSLDPVVVHEQRQYWQELQLLLASLEYKLSLLYEELETFELAGLLTPLRQLEQRFERCLRYQSHFHNLSLELQEAELQVQDLFYLMRRPAVKKKTQIYQGLEDLYNTCDGLADQLDILSQETSIALLEPLYEHLIQRVQHLQDTLDAVNL